MRKVKSSIIKNAVIELCFEANTEIRKDVLGAFKKLSKKQNSVGASKAMVKILIENSEIACKDKIPMCQDTGMVSVFLEIGRHVHVEGETIKEAVNKGVETAYKKFFLRKSIVKDPILRENTGTNTPAIVHIDIVDGDKVKIDLMPKGFGSENKSRLVMLNPTCDRQAIIDFCVETVKLAGPDACPPYILGVGIGGAMDSVTYLAKKALLRPITKKNSKKHIAKIEEDIKKSVNKLNIGVMGLGGEGTVIGVNVETSATHIAGLPVAVNLSCHALRSASVVI